MVRHATGFLLGALFLLTLTPAVADDFDTDAGALPIDSDRVYILQVQPVFTAEQTEDVFRPLVEYLNSATPYRFDLRLTRDFHRHWLEMRRGLTPDLVFEDAHLIARRIRQDGYTPLVKAEEPGTFSLMVSPGLAGDDLNALVGMTIASLPSPSLGYLILASWFDNPMQQPNILSSANSWLDAVESIFSMEAEAAVVPHNLVGRYVNLDVIATSDSFPYSSIAASPGVPVDVQIAITDALIALRDNPEYFQVLHELDIEGFIAASESDYRGLEAWLDRVFTLL